MGLNEGIRVGGKWAGWTEQRLRIKAQQRAMALGWKWLREHETQKYVEFYDEAYKHFGLERKNRREVNGFRLKNH
jgi:hypothetical protein